MRKYFGYAIDVNASKFSPLLSAATILHPKYVYFLEDDSVKALFEAGTIEIEQWIKRIPANTSEIPSIQSTRFNRLAAKRLASASNQNSSWKR